MSDFAELEKVDAVRLSWNVWPNSRVEATKCVVPFAALYTPNKSMENLTVVEYEPVPCKSCGGILNPNAQVDFNGKIWICPFCHSRNHFPSHYQGISPEALPAELYQMCSTMEYKVPHTKPVAPPAYVFVVDTCVVEEELAACRAAITKALQTLPEWAQVGLVTYGTNVHVHELGFQECAKCYVFQGTREYSGQQVADKLGLGKPARHGPQAPGMPPQQPAHGGRRFILPLSEAEFTITGVLDELQRDAFPAVAEHRPARCTGTALQVAAGMMGAALLGITCAARLMLFVGGPSTLGGGKVVDPELSEPIRSHKDLVKDAAPHFKKARKFFEGIATQLVAQGHALDVFACSLDQVGLAEMKVPVEATGGLVVQTDTYHNPVFKESMKRVFARPGEPMHLGLSSNATFEVIPSRIDGDVKVAGVLGAAAPLDKRGPAVGDQAVGMGGTTLWKLASIDSSTTLAVFFEVGATTKDKATNAQQFYVQFICRYLHSDGSNRVRVTTFTRRWTDAGNVQDLIAGFDQEAAAVITARMASHKMEVEDDFDATRWLDRTLIRLTSRFGDFRKDDPDTFQLSPNMSYFPQFMFNLRRSQFVQVFGNSPDETAYCRLVLNRETVSNAIVAIQPQLISYGINGPPEPVLLDVLSIAPDRILLLDSYFYVVVFHGTTIAQWRKMEYQLQEEHAAFKALLEAPQEEAAMIVQHRFPVPRLVDCDQNGSQARFLLAKLNPSSTHSTQSPGALSAEVILTDDVSLSVFTEHLKKLAVQS